MPKDKGQSLLEQPAAKQGKIKTTEKVRIRINQAKPSGKALASKDPMGMLRDMSVKGDASLHHAKRSAKSSTSAPKEDPIKRLSRLNKKKK